ncbi:MAG: hypothetical protein VB035_03970 [Candidatus Fimivivens sp.]|nr:hypothetical protein [Candidatus Fimivivens sp.]
MDNENMMILKPDDLIAEVKSQGQAIASSMNNQLTTLQLLNGTLLMSFGTNSQLFAGMLGELALQSSFSSAQLGEQQLYDAAALEGASAMYLLINTLSGNIKAIMDSLVALSGFGGTISANVAKYLPTIEKVGSGSSSTLGTIFSGIAAFAGLVGPIQGLGALIAPLIATFGPALAVLAGAVGVGLGLNAIVKHFTKPKNDNQTQSQDSLNTQTPSQEQSQPPEKLQTQIQTTATVPNPPTGTTQTIDPVQAAVDPFNTGEGDKSKYNQYQSQIDSSRQTADALREAVKTGNTEVAAQLEMVANALQRLADKPADRNVKSEIVINTLKTNATLSEFKDMLNETLLSNLETVE